MSFPNLPAALPSLSTREAIIDGLYRAILGLDTADEALFDSAFTQDATVNINGQVMNGLDQIRSGMFKTVAPLNTSHFLTNVRVSYKDGETTAFLTASALSQHFRPGQGEPGSENLLTGGLYYLESVKDDDGLWKAKTCKVSHSWAQGDRAIFGGN